VKGKEVRDVILKSRMAGNKKLEDEAAHELLEGYGIPVARSRFCKNLPEALKAAEEIGYPVVLKVSSPQITHKTDVGAIGLNLMSAAEIRETYHSCMTGVKKRTPQAQIQGVFVQEMISGGVEVILGAKRDRQFGPIIIFGTGGIHTEVWKDISYGIAPLNPQGAEKMVGETRCSRILRGAREEGAYDVDLIIECLLRTSQFMVDMEEVQEIDINPFTVFHRGGVAIDVKIYLSSVLSEPRGSKSVIQ
jgi:succinyl-CoA synthetase beta subunit